MKNKVFCFGLLLIFLQFSPLNAQQKDYQSIADKVVNQVLEVQPGEVVLISATPAELDMLNDFIIEVFKSGGKAHVELSVPEANKVAIMNTPVEYLKIPNNYVISRMRNVDCFINMGSIQDPELFSDVPEERLVASRKSGIAAQELNKSASYRSASLGQTGGIPSRAYAKKMNADYDEMMEMFWNALDVDYNKMARDGKAMAAKFNNGKKVKLTSPAGTNLNFRIGDSQARLNCGLTSENVNSFGPSDVWLPAGEAFVGVDPSSANGILVVPKTTYRGKTIKNLSMDFRNGKMTKISADTNLDILKNAMEMSTGDATVFSLLDIGLNPNSKLISGSDYSSWEMAGMVTVGLGNNTWAGGEVESDNAFTFHLTGSTLTLDGEVLVKDGALVNKVLSNK